MKTPKYLIPNDYMAGQAVFPKTTTATMNDYHVFSIDDLENDKVTDHGVILKIEDIDGGGSKMAGHLKKGNTSTKDTKK